MGEQLNPITGKYLIPKHKMKVFIRGDKETTITPNQIYVLVSFVRTGMGYLISVIPVEYKNRFPKLTDAIHSRNSYLIDGLSSDFTILSEELTNILDVIYS